jgi:Fe(3+) dicitrate transport protein
LYRTLTSALALVLAASAAPALAGAPSPAPAPNPTSEDPAILSPIVVVGSRAEARAVGGSATYLDEAALETFAYADVHRILRQAPGVVLQEEDGFGLRPNIGIRGSGTDRSARVALMEDGVLIAPAPYAAPAAYYFPRLARMTGVEITKGPGAIKYGPLTTGGAVNLTSTPIGGGAEEGLAGRISLLGGEFGSIRAHGAMGGWISAGNDWQVGGQIELLHEQSDGFKQLDNGGPTGFEIDDAVFRLGLRTDPGAAGMAQALTLKYQTLTERSDETYLGLTVADFAADPYRRYAGSQLDVMDVEHDTLQLTHSLDVTPSVNLTTTAYRHDTTRAWYKLNDVRNGAGTGWVGISTVLANPAAHPISLGIVRGDAGVVSGAQGLRVRNNNRVYASEGIQSVLTTRFDTGGLSHELELSARYHQDSEDRFQRDDIYRMNNGVMELTTRGVDGAQANRVAEAEAWAFFIRDTIRAGRLTLTPGLRYESIDLRRIDYPTSPPGRAAPTAVIESGFDVWSPGVGATYQLTDSVLLVAGAHRGFSNPGPGSDADPETSWNYEAGLRYDGAVSLEAIAYLNDYDNLLGSCTASTGGGCTIGDQFSGGAVEVRGLEVTASWDAGQALGRGFGVPLSLVYTLSDGEFMTSFSSDYEPWGVVASGDELPYLPRHQLTLNAGLDFDRWSLDASINRVSETRSVAGSGPIAAGERIDARTLVDLAATVELTSQASLFASVQNVTDEVYNVSFSPAGSRPGAPRLAMAGIRLRF